LNVEPLLEENARLPNDEFKSTILKSINEFLLGELAGDDISRCFTTKSLLGKGWPKGQDGNFRIDKQPVSLFI